MDSRFDGAWIPGILISTPHIVLQSVEELPVFGQRQEQAAEHGDIDANTVFPEHGILAAG